MNILKIPTLFPLEEGAENQSANLRERPQEPMARKEEGRKKACFRCHIQKPLSEFYNHPAMGDGHLNKCKTCTKSDARNNKERKMKDVNWVLSERERHRKKSEKARREGRASVSSRETRLKWIENNKEKTSAHNILNKALKSGKISKMPCEICKNPKTDGHHHDYSKPLDVKWLCRKHHAEEHVRINEQKLREKFLKKTRNKNY